MYDDGTNFIVIPLDEDAETLKKDENEYGLIDPLGNYYPAEWGNHTAIAYRIISSKPMLDAEYEKIFQESKNYMSGLDFLVWKKNWILLHNPGLGLAYPTINFDGRVTRHQRDFLYSYYMIRDEEDWADYYFDKFKYE